MNIFLIINDFLIFSSGCTSKQLSELIGCDASYISKVENGRIIPPLDKIILVADYFGVEFTELFK